MIFPRDDFIMVDDLAFNQFYESELIEYEQTIKLNNKQWKFYSAFRFRVMTAFEVN